MARRPASSGATDDSRQVSPSDVSIVIDELLAEDMDADWIVAEVARRYGGTARYLNGTYELRIAGIVGTCTAGGVGQLKSWQRAAARKIAA